MAHRLLAIPVLTLVALSLVACDPPIPPDVQAQIAEQKHVCVDGSSTVFAPSSLQDVLTGWSESLSADCTGMTLASVAKAPENILISSFPSSDCDPQLLTPLAVDGAAIAFTAGEVTDLLLTPKTAAGVLNGEITDWSDPAIKKENPDQDLAPQPITVSPNADQLSFDALNAWLTRLGAPLNASRFKLSQAPAKATEIPDGTIAIVPISVTNENNLSTAQILTRTSDKTNGIATTDSAAVVEGASQWKATTSAGKMTVKLDASLKPLVPQGFNLVEPYQAVYPLNVQLCKPGAQTNQAAAYYLLRLSSQGSLATSTYSPLPENVRVSALQVMGKGLPAGK
jgi:ABC-type phosphate transport system substrate-binding protein